MGLLRARQEQPPQRTTDSTIETLKLAHTPGIESILLSYSRLPKNEITPLHRQHFAAARNVLWDAVDTFSEEMEELSHSRFSAYQAERVSEDYHKVVERARRLDFPAIALKPISFEFIDVSLNPEKNLPPHVHEAVKEMALAIGNNKVHEAKVRHIAQHHLSTLESARGKSLTDAQIYRVLAAENLLSELGVNVGTERIPSVVNNIAEYTRKHGRSVALTGSVALISSAILAPSMATATEVPVSNITVSSGTTTENAPSNLAIGMPSNSPDVPSTVSISGPSKAPDASLVNATIDVNIGSEANKKQASVPISAAPEVAVPDVSTVPVTISVETKSTTPPEASVSVTIPTPVAEANTKPDTVVDSKTITVPEAPLTTDGEPIVTDPVAVITKNETATPPLDKNTATPEQLAAQTITNTLNNDGDIATAASLIRLTFHDKNEVVTSYKNGKPVYETTNPALVKNITGLEIAYEDLMAKGGHADPNYVNTTLAALAVLDAAANDQSVLSSPDVQQLIAGVRRPDDAYQAKLYDQYLAKAKVALAANDSALLVGINVQYKAQVETMYTYILLASVSDTDQATQIQAIKDAEAAAAAAAAKAAADAAAAAAGANNTSPEADALKNLHDREQDPAKQRTFYVLNYLMTHAGLTAPQAAGVIGNLLVESASTMDPSIKQFNGGPAKGIAQWEAGRLVALQNYAASKGKPWDDLDTQLDFLISELDGRQNTLERVKGSQNVLDAANNFMVHFETPNVVVKAYKSGDWSKADAQAQIRAGRGQAILDAFNGEVTAVNAARAAAAAAEAERQAKMGMNLEQAKAFVASYKNSPDSINFIGESGTHCNGGPLSNCTSFSVYFINKFSDLGGMVTQMPGNGSTVVQNLAARNPGLETGHVARPNAVFSTPSGSQMCGPIKCGHTGVVLGVDEARGKVIIGEAGCGATSVWDTAREYDLAKFNSKMYTYAYVGDHLKAAIK
jgi:hypothetical protein